MTQEALKLALVALEHAAYCVQKNYCPDKMGHDWDDTIAAVKEALAHPWVGLTDDDLLQIRESVQIVEGQSPLQSLTKAIEAKLKEKNT